MYFTANSGDRLTVKGYDYYGGETQLCHLYLHHIPTGKTFWLSDGYPQRPVPRPMGFFFDETFTIPEVESEISIKNAKATPEEFTPGKKEENNKTNITAQIVANSSIQVDSIQWQVTIKDESDATVKTFETRTGTAGSGPWDVSETWDGKNDAGDYVDYGKYSFKISATATSNGTEKKADAVGSVQVAPQYPTLTKLTFENTLDIKYDDGENVKPIYYKAKDTDITQNPFAIPLSRLTPVDSDKVKGKCNITLEIPNKPVKAISFEVRIKSHSDTVIVEKEYITFDGNKKESSKDVDFTVPSKIQTIKGYGAHLKYPSCAHLKGTFHSHQFTRQ